MSFNIYSYDARTTFKQKQAEFYFRTYFNQIHTKPKHSLCLVEYFLCTNKVIKQTNKQTAALLNTKRSEEQSGGISSHP